VQVGRAAFQHVEQQVCEVEPHGVPYRRGWAFS
jgi:hypothetical protein